MLTRRLQDVFCNSRALFDLYTAHNWGWHIKYGFDTPDDFWNANPMVQL